MEIPILVRRHLYIETAARCLTLMGKLSNVFWQYFNSLAPGRRGSNFKRVIFKHMLQINFMSTFCEIAMEHLWWQVNIDSDNGLVLSGIKPRVLHQGSSARQIQPNFLSFGQAELTTWLFGFKYQYTWKFLHQPRKWLFGQPARKLSVDPCKPLPEPMLTQIPVTIWHR